MNPWTPWIQGASLLVATFVASWSIVQAHKKEEAAKGAAMWKRIDAFKQDLQKAQDELLVLKEQLKYMPTRDLLDRRFQMMEDKIEKRLDGLGDMIRELSAAAK